ncbi:outer membrane protein transport protein [Photobacterium phosphoreum]|uniref:outer membrane protein transport protein n=1 Tax=Photobacterium phosphoreum TaxID=659 RepID=UPI0039B1273C
MNKNNITLALAITAAMGISSHAAAAGFQLAEYSATGLGRAFAGEAAMADNASAQFRNPAMLTYLKGIQVSAGAIYVDPNIDIAGSHSNPKYNKLSLGATGSADFANSAVIPNFYFSRPLTDKATIGLAVGTHFGMRTDLGTDFKASMFGNQADVHTVEINPNLGYKINDQLSVGAGVRYVMASGHFGAALPTALGKAKLKYMEGEDNAWGWQVGTAWQINANNRIGFSYQSAVKLNLEGHANGLGFDGTGKGSYAGSLPIELPASAEIASFHQLNYQWAVHASVNWTDWSAFEKLEANIPQLGGSKKIKDENWKDNYRFAIGTTYQATNKLVLRSGIAYDTSAVDEANRTQTIPETDRTWLSVGAGYAWSENLTLDAGFTYILAKKAHMLEQEKGSGAIGEILGQFDGQTSGHIWLAGVQASYRF